MIFLLFMAIGNNKSCELCSNRSLAGPRGQTYIYYWPLGQQKVINSEITMMIKGQCTASKSQMKSLLIIYKHIKFNLS